RPAQLRLQLQSFLLLFGQLRRERLPAIATAALAVVHRHVRVLDQLLRRGAVGRGLRDADARGDGELFAVEAEAVAEDLQDRARQSGRAVRVVIQCAGHQEFVAAEARDQPLATDRAPDAAGGRGEQPVAGGVAQYVVDDLETVQIDVQHGQALARRVGEARVDLAADGVAVEQAGERIGARAHPQVLLGALAVGDVLQRPRQPLAERPAGLGLADRAYPERLAVG